MPEIFLEFLGVASPWLLILLIPLCIWGWLVRDALNNPQKKESFKQTVQMLRHGSFGEFYLLLLGKLLDKVSTWIGDRSQLTAAYAEQPTAPKALPNYLALILSPQLPMKNV